MSIRGTVWIQIGDPFDGPRIGPPIHLKWAAKNINILEDLELIIANVYKTIASQPPAAWEKLAERAEPPKLNGRRVKLDIRAYEKTDLDWIVIMRARLPFPVWPLGGWVVVEGWNRTPEGVWTLLPTEELEKTW